MKSIILALIACVTLAAGCASDKSTQSVQPGTGSTELKAGMTKREVTAILGRAHTVQPAKDGETWIYRTGPSDRLKVQIIHFDKDEKLDRWGYTE